MGVKRPRAYPAAMTTLRIASAQIAPVLFDTDATTERVVDAIAQAGAADVALVGFGECFVPGYPGWLSPGGGARFEEPEVKDAYGRYLSSGVTLDGDHVTAMRAACREHGVTAVVGILELERSGGTGYCTALVLDERGEIAIAHRKLRPTYEERLVWGPGDGHGLRTFDVRGVRCSALNCWENWMPLARTALYAQGTQLHVAIWPGSDTLTRDITRFVAKEGRVFVLSAGGRMSKAEVPDDFALGQGLDAAAWERNGGSAIAAPDGSWVVEPDTTTDGLVIGEVDISTVAAERQSFDATGHYSRPDVLRLSVDRRRQSSVDFGE